MQYTDEQSYVDIVRARNSILFSKPFFGSLIMNLTLTEETGHQFKTAATNGRTLYYNPEYIRKLKTESNDNEYIKSLVVHEALHCVFSHIVRRNDRNPLIWNFACDYIVNDNLKNSGFKVHKTWLYDEKYHDWSSEEVYEDLMKNLKFSSNGTPLNLPGKGTVLADHHPGEDGFPDDAPQDEHSIDELEEKWKDALTTAYEAHKGSGDIPGSIHRIMDKLTKPKIKWFDILRNKISEYMKSDFNWIVPNKRFFGSGIIMPSMDKVQKISLGAAIDTSGSISGEDLVSFMSEINSIVSMYNEFEINVACFDTKVYSKACIKSQDDFDSYIKKLKGGGGTNFMAWWNWAMNEKWYDNAQAILFFTDGFPSGKWLPEEAESKDIIWIIKGSQVQAPVGTSLFYDEE